MKSAGRIHRLFSHCIRLVAERSTHSAITRDTVKWQNDKKAAGGSIGLYYMQYTVHSTNALEADFLKDLSARG